MLRYLTIAILLLLSACTSTSALHRGSMVLDYTDFGPQVIAHEIIGMGWWQWQAHGGPEPTESAIKVVVYKDLPEETVKLAFPVNPQKHMDYRYIEYFRALAYLDEKIDEDVMESVTDKLKMTRERIKRHFN
jgi:hypothetical protein